MKEGLKGQSHLHEIIMKMTFCFPIVMSDYNQKLKIFCPRFIMRNVLVKLLLIKFKLTKINKFIGVT
jgi:hypothetical protein